jgi:hypothetical protein
MKVKIQEICGIMRKLVQENKFANPDMAALKAVHKKLKRCRAWESDKSSSDKKKRKKKRKAEGSTNGGDNSDGEQDDRKRAKLEPNE